MNNEIIFYSTPDGDKKVEVVFQDENFWLTQKALADLFGVEVPAISKHLANIYETGELDRESTVSIMETVRQEGSRSVKRNIEYFNLAPIRDTLLPKLLSGELSVPDMGQALEGAE